MSVRLALPGMRRQVKTDDVERRSFDGGFGGLPISINATGQALMMSRELETYSASEIAYRCIQIISNAMAGRDLAIRTTTTDAQGKEEIALETQSPLPVLWNQDPRCGLSAVTVKKVAFEQLELSGQAFLYTPRKDAASTPTALVNIFAPVTPLIDGSADSIEAKMSPVIAGYRVTTPRGMVNLLAHEVLWLRYPHPYVPWAAMAPWQVAAWSSNLDRYAREWQAGQFRNGANPSGVVYLGDVTDEQAKFVKAQMESEHTGGANAGKHLFTYGSAQANYTRIGRNPLEMGYLASHEANGRDMMYALGVPVDLVIGSATFDNRHGAWVSLWTDTLTDKFEIIQADIDRQQLPNPTEQAIFDLAQIAALQENTDAIYSRTIQVWDSDLVTMAEARKEISLEPFGDERDDMTVTQYRADFKPAPLLLPPPGVNAVPVPDAAPDAVPEDQTRSIETRAKVIGKSADDIQKIYAHHEPRVNRWATRLLAKQEKTVLNKLRKSAERSDVARELRRLTTKQIFDTDYWLDQTATGLEDAIDPVWSEGAMNMAEPLGMDWSLLDPKVTAAVKARALNTAAQITETTKANLADLLEAAVKDGLSIDAMVAKMTDFPWFSAARAVNIARTEVITGYNQASTLAAKESGVVDTKSWLTAGTDVCPDCEALDGETVGLDETFSGGSDGPGQHPSCRCCLQYQGKQIEGDTSGD